jgi:signal transduction histidine kinase
MTLRERNAHFNIDSLPRIRCLPRSLQRCFQLLIGNALERAQTDAPRIRIGARSELGEHVITISDDGLPIDPETTHRVLGRREVLVPAGTSTESTLETCRRIVDRHQGRFWIDSDPQRGTTFLIALPMLQMVA